MLKFMSTCTNYLKTSTPALLSNKVDLFSQQTRNTFILKRRYPPGLHKKHAKPHKLKSRHFVYELVEDTNVKKQMQVKVILMKDLKKFGQAGSIISVNSTKAHDTLILPKLAVYATPENITKYATKDISKASDKILSSQALTEEYLSTLDLAVIVSMDNEWTLDKKHLRIIFRLAGLHVPEDAITMPKKPISGPNLDLEQKQFYVTVKLNDEKSINVRCRIHHHTNDISKKIVSEVEYWKLPCKAIFNEDLEILKQMPVHKLLKREQERAAKTA